MGVQEMVGNIFLWIKNNFLQGLGEFFEGDLSANGEVCYEIDDTLLFMHKRAVDDRDAVSDRFINIMSSDCGDKASSHDNGC